MIFLLVSAGIALCVFILALCKVSSRASKYEEKFDKDKKS